MAASGDPCTRDPHHECLRGAAARPCSLDFRTCACLSARPSGIPAPRSRLPGHRVPAPSSACPSRALLGGPPPALFLYTSVGPLAPGGDPQGARNGSRSTEGPRPVGRATGAMSPATYSAPPRHRHGGSTTYQPASLRRSAPPAGTAATSDQRSPQIATSLHPNWRLSGRAGGEPATFRLGAGAGPASCRRRCGWHGAGGTVRAAEPRDDAGHAEGPGGRNRRALRDTL